MELLLRARELAVARKRRESRALVERADPGSAEELSLAASVLVELRDPQAALPLARRAVALAPDDWRGHLAVADATFQLRWWGSRPPLPAGPWSWRRRRRRRTGRWVSH